MCPEEQIHSYKSPEEVLVEFSPSPPSETLLNHYISLLIDDVANAEFLHSKPIKRNVSTCFFQSDVFMNENTRNAAGKLTFWVWMKNTSEKELRMSQVMTIERLKDAVIETRRYRDRTLEILCRHEGEHFWVGIATLYTHGAESLGDDVIPGPGRRGNRRLLGTVESSL